MLCNKKKHKLGFHLLKVDMKNPESDVVYLISWNNKLDIGDCDMQLMKENKKHGLVEHSIVVSYKIIGINTYNVFVIDLDSKDHLIRYWFESY